MHKITFIFMQTCKKSLCNIHRLNFSLTSQKSAELHFTFRRVETPFLLTHDSSGKMRLAS